MHSELIRFSSLYQTRVWGGRRLQTHLGRELPDAQPYGEAWELVDRPEAQSLATTGRHAGSSLHQLWQQHREEVFGPQWSSQQSERFPLLIKVLDCADDLSIQVHPPVHRAAELGGEPKTEMWYVAAADPGAQLYAGLKAGISQAHFRQALAAGTMADCVHTLHPQAGDSLHVPSGRLHALGKGLLIYEIQQNSDTTYRVFDWNRLGLDGQPRALHVEQSLQSIDFTDAEPSLLRQGTLLSQCPYFTVRRSRSGDAPLAPSGCRLLMAISPLHWHGQTLQPGTVALQPASSPALPPEGEWLEISLGQ